MAPHASMILTDPAIYEPLDKAAEARTDDARRAWREKLLAAAADLEATGGQLTAAGLRALAWRV